MTGTIELIGQPLFNGYYYFTSGYCPLDESMYCFGGPPGALVTRIQLRPSVDEDVVTGITGDTGFLNHSAPGVAWHPGRQRFVIWIGGKDPYLFDPASRPVKRETLGGDNLAIRRLNGTYGRFRYCGSDDMFMLVNKAAQPVFYARLAGSAGSGSRIDLTIPAGRTVALSRRPTDSSNTLPLTVNNSDRVFVNGTQIP